MWHFYIDSTLILHIIETRIGRLKEVTLGADIDKGESFQTVVNSGSWFAASVIILSLVFFFVGIDKIITGIFIDHKARFATIGLGILTTILAGLSMAYRVA